MTKHYRWTEQALALLGTASDAKIAEQLGVKLHVVVHKRKGIAAFQKQAKWTEKEIALLGTASDAQIALKVGRNKKAVTFARQTRGIPAHDQVVAKFARKGGRPSHKPKTATAS